MSKTRRLAKANVEYLRCGRVSIQIATKGEHQFFREEANMRDIRKTPLKFGGYSISFRRDGHLSAQGNPLQRRVHVRIEDTRFKELVAEFEHLACRESADRLAARLYELPYQGYAPVRRQLCTLLRLVNRRRRVAGLGQLPTICMFLNRNAYPEPRRMQLSLRPSARSS